MKHGYKSEIAKQINVTPQFMSMFFNKKRKLSWQKAKLAGSFTGTDPVWWAEGLIDQIEAALDGVI